MSPTLAAASTSVQTSVQALGPEWLDPQYIIEALGPWALAGVCLIIFAECGLLVGFFLPGDSLLFITGLAVVTGLIDTPLWLVCVLLVVCAFLGNVLGYWIGWKAGPAVFDRPNSRLFKRENVERTQKFFDKYGNRAIVLGRFVPIVRTFITVMAGVGRMDTRRYMTFSLVGGVLWAAGVTLLGAGLGQFSFVKDNIEAMLILVVLLSILPIVFEMIKARRERKLGAQGLAEDVLDGATDEPTQVIDTRRTDRR
ncbi:DedA family protein [Actinomycetospora cinnamomea]|uniref:DedA family protein n=1 Tax=Actinomycetospora cinnamomea TaxID=663609 RepID=UPI001A9C96D2|nr:VTT domain-containing protein [Actinomycetospora cinnamomea]